MTMESVSIIIPVLNEESGINETISHVKQISSGRAVEIIVVDGDAAGSTIHAITDLYVIRTTSRPGRAMQMNAGAQSASGDIVLFLHADTFLPHRAIGLIQYVMKSGRYAAGAFSLGLDSEKLPLRVIAAAARLRTRMTGIPFGDQSLFMRREYFCKIGGFAEIPLMEDVEIASRIKKLGGRIAVLPERVTTSARKWEREGIVYSIFRNWLIQLSYFMGAPPERLAKIYYSS